MLTLSHHRRIVAVLALAAALGSTTLAHARSTRYEGKASGGHKVTFTRSGARVSALSTAVPTICTSTDPAYPTPRHGLETFRPPGSFGFGAETRRVGRHRSLFYPATLTMHHRVKLARAARGRVRGRLRIAFLYLQPVYDYLSIHYATFHCQGFATFTARPR